MIILQFLLVILAILPPIPGHSNDPSDHQSKKLDWSKCGTTNKCFCSDTSRPNYLKEAREDVPENEINCKIGVQNRFFTEQTAVFQLQMLGVSIEMEKNPKLMLLQGIKEIFGCEFKNGENGEISVVGNKEMINKYRIELFEKRSYCNAQNCLCALKLGRANYLSDDINKKSVFKSSKSIMKIIGDTKEYDSNEYKAVYDKRFISCNPYSFKDRTSSALDKVLPLSNKHLDKLNCEIHGKEFTMRYQKLQEEEVKIDELECAPVENDPNSYIFSIIKYKSDGTAEKETLKDPDQYTFYCAATLNELCKDPTPSPCPASELCPKFLAVPGKPATLTCPDKKWLIEDQYYELAEDAACKPSIRDKNNPIFFLSLPSSPDKEVKDARCFKEYDCMKKAKPFTPDCDDIKNCATIEYAEGSLKCKKPDIDLHITSTEPKYNESMRVITCDTATGSWKNSSGAVVPDNAQIQCTEPLEPEKKIDPDLSTGSLAGLIIGIFCGVAVLAAAIVAIGNWAWTHRKWMDIISKKSWMKYSTAERLKHNKAIFDPLVKMTVTTESICNGLERVHLMLETETEEPELWEDVYLFLLRFSHAIWAEDSQVWHMFNRYLYVQAKKIIDKHGWTSKIPITRKNPKGVIRVVAIRLLALSMFDNAVEEPEKLLRKGYLKLGFHANSQYPHCGVMWAIVPHLLHHQRKKKKNETGRKKHFGYEKFANKLNDVIVKYGEMPEGQMIPQFGSITQQAAYALGNYKSSLYQRFFAKDILLSKKEHGEVSAQYFKGMDEVQTHNPIEIVHDMMYQEAYDDFMKRLCKVAPQTTWITRLSHMCRTVTYCGSPLDAKKIQTRFLPDMNDDWPFLPELQTSQEFYERAMTKQSEGNRAWLEEHTDKPELKVRPVYTTSGPIQLDARIKTGNEKDVNTPNAKSCGGSDSDSKSDGKPGGSKSSNSDDKPKPAGSDSTPEGPAAPAPDATVTGVTGATTGGTTAGGAADTRAGTATGVTGATGGSTAA